MDWIAGYAAVVGTAALGWEVWNASRPRRPDVNVGVSVVGSGRDDRLTCMLVVRNRGDHPIKVEEVGIRMAGKPVLYVALTSHNTFDSTVPGVVEPSDAGVAGFESDVLRDAGMDLWRPVDGYAILSTQEWFWSWPTVLRA